MANTIKIKQSSVAAKIPLAGDLEQGELALNTTDEILYTKNASGVVTPLTSSLLDEDDFASNSDTQGATQQSIKTYVDDTVIAMVIALS